MIKTFEEAYKFVLENKVCTLFASKGVKHPSLWDNVDLPEKQEGEDGWGQKITAIWTWKNELPMTYPDEIFYGKIKGGHAVLMDMGYLQKIHYPEAYQDVEELSALAQKMYDYIRMEPWLTGDLRNLIRKETGVSKSKFDTALKHLQISLNIARSNDLDDGRDRWVAFTEMYPDFG